MNTSWSQAYDYISSSDYPDTACFSPVDLRSDYDDGDDDDVDVDDDGDGDDGDHNHNDDGDEWQWWSYW